jgi:peptidoglycan/xylan/chitin deacetylase (PgdA/CDA1 family)
VSAPRRIVAVNFHGIGTPERTLEPGEAPFWIGEGRFRDIVRQIAAHPARERIRITFDDGNRSDRTIALPVLQASGLRADFFVLTGRIGQPGSLDAADIRALRTAGMGIGSHGVAHRHWNSLGAAELREELVGSKAALEALLGEEVAAAAVPFGSYSRGVLAALRAAGYRAVWTSDGGMADLDAFLRPRTSVRDRMDASAIAGLLEETMPPLRRLRRALGMARKRLL